jgi:formate--tetrahydrofolate ligase
VALNRFPGDTDAELEGVMAHCRSLGIEAALAEGYSKGGEGMTELAAKIAAAASSHHPAAVKPLYAPDLPLDDKIRSIATQVYGASGVVFKPAARQRLDRLSSLGYGSLPVCVAKTQYSFTDDPKQMGAPTGWTLTVSDVTLSAGAGFVVAVAGNMMLMPGLGKVPQAHHLDVDEMGKAVGMDY